MALTLTKRGTGTHNTGATSFTLNPGSDFTNAKGQSKAALFVAADNSSSGGSTNDFTTVTDTLGNTWVKRQSPVFDNGAASAGVQGALFTTAMDAGKLVTGTTITVAFGSSPVAKTWSLWEVAGASGSSASWLSGGNKSAGATSTALTTGASASITSGDAILAGFFLEAGTSQSISAEDTDNSNGAWSTAAYAEIGTTTSGSVIAVGGKVTTGTATQTYDLTVGVSSDYHASWGIFHEDANPTPTTLALTLTTFAPTVGIGVLVTPGVVALTSATFAPTIAHQINGASPTALTLTTFAPRIDLAVVPATAALTVSSFAPTVSATDNQTATPATLGLVLTTFEPTVSTTNNQLVVPDPVGLTVAGLAPVLGLGIVPGTVALATSGLAPTVTASDHQTVTPTTASLTLTTFAPTVSVSQGTTVVPDPASIVLSSFAPVLGTGLEPATAAVTLSSFAPTVTATDHKLVTPPTAALSLTTFPPGVGQPTSVTPATVALTLATFAPDVSVTVNVLAVPDPAVLELTAFAPDVVATDYVVATPATAVLVLTSFAPDIEQARELGEIRGAVVAGLDYGATMGPVGGSRSTIAPVPGSSAASEPVAGAGGTVE